MIKVMNEEAIPTGVYLDPDTGQRITTHSMVKCFRRCPKQFNYKYIERLRPKALGRPLSLGTWFHTLLETYYKEGDWKEAHAELTKKYYELFEEERDELGPLPEDCERLMRSYLWHYSNEVWKIHEVEYTLEAEWPDGTVYRGRIDLLVENQFGLWIVDHKTTKRMPDLGFRLLDAQSALYIWAALKNKIPVQGHIWNYVVSKPPTIPKLLKDGSRIARLNQLNTDYPTLVKFIKANEIDPRPYKTLLMRLKSQQYEAGAMQTSPFFIRSVLEKSNEMLKKVASEAYHTSKRMHAYPFHQPEIVERVADRSCTFSCSYTELCTMELFGGNTNNLRKQKYTVGDPLYYYGDPHEQEKGE